MMVLILIGMKRTVLHMVMLAKMLCTTRRFYTVLTASAGFK